MKFVLDGLSLGEAVMKTSKACAVRTTAPIMECIRITARRGEVELLATDGELSIRKTVKAEVFDEGDICVPGKLFSDFIGKLSDVEVTVFTGEKGLGISYLDNVSYLQSIGAEEFPKIGLEIGENYLVMKSGSLKTVIARTVFCCAQDDSRPILKGCLLEWKDALEVTALDGYRLAIATAPIVAKSGENSIICPARTLVEISRMLEGDEEEITLYTQGGMLLVSSGNMTIVSRLYQGEFIRKSNVLPPTFSTQAFLKRAELVASVERAAVFIRGDRNNLVTLEIGGDIVGIKSDSDIGNVAEIVRGETRGPDLIISMNAKYLLDALKALSSEKVILSFNTAVSPFIIQDLMEKEGLYLILPVRNAQ